MELLGNVESAWLDESKLPKAQRDFAITLFERLGLRRTPSRAHIVQHIEDITSSSPDKRNREVIGQLLHFLSSHFESWKRDDENLSDLDTLKSSAWLPAKVEGEDDEENWYEPDEIYQPFRAIGFDSRVAILSVRGSRSAPLKGEFLDFLGVPAEPSTAVVVAHLNHCMDQQKPANNTTYQILFERLGNEDDVAGR